MKHIFTNLAFLLLIIVLISGFYFILSDLQSIKRSVANLDLNFELLYSNRIPESVIPGSAATSTEEEEREEVGRKPLEGTRIPTAILFNKQSSPALSPQTLLTISLEEVVKGKEGVVTMRVKVFTSRAVSYSAIDLAGVFELVNLEGQNQRPIKVSGALDSMPPESAVNGEVVFKIPADQNSIILQINIEDGINYYRFDFNKKSYEEAILG